MQILTTAGAPPGAAFPCAPPQARLRAALASAHFILKPDVHLLRRNAWRQRLQDFGSEVFFEFGLHHGIGIGLEGAR